MRGWVQPRDGKCVHRAELICLNPSAGSHFRSPNFSSVWNQDYIPAQLWPERGRGGWERERGGWVREGGERGEMENEKTKGEVRVHLDLINVRRVY